MLAGASLLAIAGGVSAEPMTLSATQMDGVSAGGVLNGVITLPSDLTLPGVPSGVPSFVPSGVPTLSGVPSLSGFSIGGSQTNPFGG